MSNDGFKFKGMKKLKDILFSMASSVVLLTVFAVSIAYATFVENEQGTEIARKLIYNAFWFETLLALLVINLLGSVVRYEILNKRKFSILLFHIAFIIILVGAGITRYFGSEGVMHIREGETVHEISTDKTSVRIVAEYQGQQVEKSTEAFFAENTAGNFSEKINIADKTIHIKSELFIPNSVETIVPDQHGEPAVSLFVMNAENRSADFILLSKQTNTFEKTTFAFEDTTTQPDILFFREKDALYFKSSVHISKMGMMEQKQAMITPGEVQIAEQKTIYKTGNIVFVVKTFIPKARKNLTQITPGMDESGIIKEGNDALVFSVSDGNINKRLNILNSKSGFSMPASTALNDVKITISYGPLTYKLPFSIKLHDFQLERYPGSNSPSSYASEITVIDPEKQQEQPFRIYMNNILKYKGYRFFQSSYDQDERGTILSVSNDYWGTLITYIGYFLLMFGMLLTLFNKNSRFRTVLKLSGELQKSKKHKKKTKSNSAKSIVLILLTAISISATGADFSKSDHIKSLESLLIQDGAQGRTEPFNTYASDVFRKISKETSYNQMSPTEVVLRMIADPENWQNEPIIKVANTELARELGAINGRLSFNQLFDFENGGAYRLSEKIDQVYQKNQTERNKYDKELVNLDERVNICYEIFNAKMLNLFPIADDPSGKWRSVELTNDAQSCPANNTQMGGMGMPPAGMGGMSNEQISAMMGMNVAKSNVNEPDANKKMLENYLISVNEALNNGNWSRAENQLTIIKNYQHLNGVKNIPSQSKIELEITYNKINLFGKLGVFYVIAGLLLLAFHLLEIFSIKSQVGKFLKYAIYPFALLFVIYSLGLAARWYIADHAPWSNGYETMIFVGWATALAGLIFARKSPITLAVTGILSAIALFVAGMSWMNPEITNLVPVLKSYWLIIHVAIITSSYGFLAMGALLGLLNLVLMIARNKKNNAALKISIQEISYIIELALMIGLLLLTAGCFIGGIWANESWGRYWGWDPKETWALVSIIVYSAILHLRNVPKLNNQFVLSSLALVGFSSIIMTFFGVNYYLSGMHSYGQGTPPPIPTVLYFIVVLLGLIIFSAYKKEKKNKSKF